jgi:tetratricopeptide (TPR) repeat protein
LLVFSAHAFFLSGCAVETREFRGTASASHRVFPQPARVEFTLPVVIAVPALALALWAGTESNLRIWQDDISLFRRAVETAPENPIMKDNLATAYLNQGRPADALPLLRQVVAMLPIYGHGYYNLGRCYHQMGNDAEAERYFSIADQILSVNRAFYKEQVQGKFR